MDQAVVDAVTSSRTKKRKKVPSSKARGMEHYRGLGYLVGNTEMTVPGGFKSDLFGLFDFVAIRGDDTYGVQACLVTDLEAHKKKLGGNTNLMRVLAANWKIRLIVFWPWKKEEHRGEFKEYAILENGNGTASICEIRDGFLVTGVEDDHG